MFKLQVYLLCNVFVSEVTKRLFIDKYLCISNMEFEFRKCDPVYLLMMVFHGWVACDILPDKHLVGQSTARLKYILGACKAQCSNYCTSPCFCCLRYLELMNKLINIWVKYGCVSNSWQGWSNCFSSSD